jgi:hypothetical protein
MSRAGKITPTDTVDYIAEEIAPVYWYWHNSGKEKSKPKLMFDVEAFYQYLTNKGLRWLNTDGKLLNRILVRVKNNVVSETTASIETSQVFYDVAGLPDEMENKEAVAALLTSKIQGGVMKPALLNKLPELRATFQRDISTAIYVFFSNSIVKITRDEITALPYTRLPQPIWASQIKPHKIEIIPPEFTKQTFSDFNFCKFLNHVCTERDTGVINMEQLATIKTSIGYLIHNYVDFRYQKIVVLSDASLEPVANGGTGKSIICTAVEQMRKMAWIDGKRFKPDDRFAFQSLGFDTQVVCFDDITEKFPIEILNSAVTSSYTFEQKNAHSITYAPSCNPRTVITTNFTIRNAEGDTIQRRIAPVELANYYNASFTPSMEFGGEIFFKWEDAEDWNKFYNFMFSCCQEYLQNDARITAYTSDTMEMRSLMFEVGVDFLTFAEGFCGMAIDSGQWFTLMKLLDAYLAFDSSSKYPPSKQALNKKLRKYCATMGYKITKAQMMVESTAFQGGKMKENRYLIEKPVKVDTELEGAMF